MTKMKITIEISANEKNSDTDAQKEKEQIVEMVKCINEMLSKNES